jgi:hypothetical protein
MSMLLATVKGLLCAADHADLVDRARKGVVARRASGRVYLLVSAVHLLVPPSAPAGSDAPISLVPARALADQQSAVHSHRDG